MISNQQCRPYDRRFLKFAATDNQTAVYKAYGKCGSIVNETARVLDKDASHISQVVRCIQKKAELHFGELEYDDEFDVIQMKPLKIWIYDIETTPTKGYFWRYWNENIGHGQVLEYGKILSFAGKWLGEEDIHYEENRTKANRVGSDKKITQSIINFFDEADIVIGHNGKAFDCKTVTGKALKHGIKPPSPYKIVDTMLSAKRYFKMPRNSLECLADELGCSGKLNHKAFPGFSMWRECIKGNPEAWEEMEIYNRQDVVVLEEVYLKMRPWISDHPNMGVLMEEGRKICPKCGSGEIKTPRRKKTTTTNTQVYPLYICGNCNGYARGRTTISDKRKRKQLTVHAV